MEQYTVPKTVCDKLAEARKRAAHRTAYTKEEIEQFCKDARVFGVGAALKRHKKISRSSGYRLFEEYKMGGWQIIPEPEVRGRRSVVSNDEKNEIINVVETTRKTTKAAVGKKEVAAIATGIVMKNHGLILRENGGVFTASHNWVEKMMKRGGFGRYARTTTRVVPASTIVAAADSFFASIKETKAPQCLTFNADEFFALLGKHNAHHFTYHRCNDKRRVPMRDTKLGFTMTILTSASGELHLIQMLWEGATDRCHAEGEDHPLVYQDHRRDSHFQNQETWERFVLKFISIVEKVRIANNLAPTVPACFIVDAATQHGIADHLVRQLVEKNIFIRRIPEEQTHVYQPADAYIISVFKTAINKAFSDYITLVVANLPADEATKTIWTGNVAQLRKVKYALVCRAVNNYTSRSILASWEVTGILRECFGLPSARPVNIDEWRRRAGGLVEVIEVDEVVVIDSEADSDDSSDDEEGDLEGIEVPELGGADFVPVAPEVPHIPEEFRIKWKPTPQQMNEQKKLQKELKQEKRKLFLDFSNEMKKMHKDFQQKMKKAKKFWWGRVEVGNKRDRDD